jgi:hypothetical protein
MRFNTYQFLAYHKRTKEIAAGVEEECLVYYYGELLERLDQVMTWWDRWSWDLIVRNPETLTAELCDQLHIPVLREAQFKVLKVGGLVT